MLTVTTTSDIVDANDGVLSLREAVEAVSWNWSHDTISFDQSLLDANGKLTIALNSELYFVGGVTTIEGDVDLDGIADVTLDGQYVTRHIEISLDAWVALNNVVLTSGLDSATSGASLSTPQMDYGRDGNAGNAAAASILNHGVLTLTDVVILNNIADGGAGGFGERGVLSSGNGGQGGDAATIVSDNYLELNNVHFLSNSLHGGTGGIGGVANNSNETAGNGGQGGTAAEIVNSGVLFLTNVEMTYSLFQGGVGGQAGYVPSWMVPTGTEVAGTDGDATLILNTYEAEGDLIAVGNMFWTPSSAAIVDRDNAYDAVVLHHRLVEFASTGMLVTEGNGGTTLVTVKLVRPELFDNLAFAEVIINSSTADADDFASHVLPLSQFVLFEAGMQSVDVTFEIDADYTPENDEIFTLSFGNTGGMDKGAQATTTVIILNDDTEFSIVPLDAGAIEGGDHTFKVVRLGIITAEQTVDWTISGTGGDPARANDFTGGILPTGTVTFLAGETEQTITVHSNADFKVEGDEAFQVMLTSASEGATIGIAAATGTIVNDDSTLIAMAPAFDITEGNSGATEVEVFLYRIGATGGALTLDWAVVPDTASAADFAGAVFPFGAISFAAGENAKTVTFEVAGNTVGQFDRTFAVEFHSAAGYAVAMIPQMTIIDDDAIVGTDSSETLTGTAGNDFLNALDGNDTLNAGGGDDILIGGAGADVLHGDAGNDTANYALSANAVTVDLSTGATSGGDATGDTLFSIENLTGSAYDDHLAGDANGNILDGGAGNDTMTGGDGNDVYIVDSASDAVFEAAGQGTDRVETSLGSYFLGTDIEDLTLTGSGSHFVFGNGLDNVMVGGNGDAIMFGDAGYDTLIGGDGNDTLVGNVDIFAQESDTLIGGAGNDTILGEHTDVVDGGAGYDSLYAINSYNWSIDLGATHIEWLSAGFGDDTITAATQTATVTVYASGGNDQITGSNFDDFLWAESGNDTIDGGGGNDVIIGDVGADSLSGGAGNDSIYTDGADANLDGGDGTDAVYIVGGSGLTLNLSASHFEWIGDYAGGNDNLDGSGMTADLVVYAGDGVDVIQGGSGNDFLWGGGFNDQIDGGAGNDVLVGGWGADTLVGGTGNDVIYASGSDGADNYIDLIAFNTAGFGTDVVYDFEIGIDKIVLGSFALDGSLTIDNINGNAVVGLEGDQIIVIGAGGMLSLADFIVI